MCSFAFCIIFWQRYESRTVTCRWNKLYEMKLVCFWRDSPQWASASSFTKFLDHTQWHVTVGRTSLDEWSACRRDPYLTTHSTPNRHPCPGGIRTHSLSRRVAADLRPRSRSHWNRQMKLAADWNNDKITTMVKIRKLCKILGSYKVADEVSTLRFMTTYKSRASYFNAKVW